jgi:hypothetical protein
MRPSTRLDYSEWLAGQAAYRLAHSRSCRSILFLIAVDRGILALSLLIIGEELEDFEHQSLRIANTINIQAGLATILVF